MLSFCERSKIKCDFAAFGDGVGDNLLLAIIFLHTNILWAD